MSDVIDVSATSLTPCRPAHASCAVRSDMVVDLIRIFESDVQLAICSRPVNPLIHHWLDEHAADLTLGMRQTIHPDELPNLSRLPAGPGRDALAEDIRFLSEIFFELLDPPALGFRLEIVHKAMCPRFHVDRVGLRMLCTYRGAGTDWVEESHIDRAYLGALSGGQPDESSGLLRPGHQVHTIEPYAIALLKGTLWQGNDGRGIVHRSPAVTPDQSPRVLVALDTAWLD
jgi:Protein of unknown function (DUF1826)